MKGTKNEITDMTISLSREASNGGRCARWFARRLGPSWAPALVVPLLVLMILFFAAPIAQTISTSFSTREGAVSVDQYIRFFSDAFYLRGAVTTFRVAAETTIVCAVLGYPLSLLMARGTPLQSKILMMATIIPLMVNVVVRAYGWTIILGRTGVVNTSLVSVGLIEAPLRILYNELAVVLGSVHVFLPLLVLPLRASIEKIDRRTEEAARTLGSSAVQVFFYITLPQSLPGLTAGAVMVFSLTASSFVIPALLGGDFVKMLGPLAEEQLLSVFDWEFGAAIAVILTLLIGLVAGGVAMVAGKFVRVSRN